MESYDAFATFYDGLGMSRFSEDRAVLLCSLLGGRPLSSLKLLDMACGTGCFCELMAQRGINVAGFDLSPGMVSMAKQRQIPGAHFFVADMCDFDISDDFDIVTCNYDSLNHLLSQSKVEAAFRHVFRHLKPGGMFCFDVNTVSGLRRWRYQDLRHDASSVMLRHGVFDEATNHASLFIDAFVARQDGLYSRFEELIHEAAYPLAQVVEMLKATGFADIEPVGRSAGKSTADLERDPRAIFLGRKPL